MRLFIEPVDVWLFRDGRPFTAGSDHRAQSLFPPYPTVMQGVVRSHHLVVHNVDLADRKAIKEVVGTATDYKDLRLRGPFVARRNENGQVVRYFPVPADAVWRGKQVQALKPQDKTYERIVTSSPTPLLLWDAGEPEKPKGNYWLSQADLEAYLHGHTVAPIAGENLFQRESRLGIGLDDDTRTTRQVGDGGLLYEVAFIRACDGVGLEVEVRGLDGWPATGVMRMGGEDGPVDSALSKLLLGHNRPTHCLDGSKSNLQLPHFSRRDGDQRNGTSFFREMWSWLRPP